MKKLIYGLLIFITSITITSCMEDGPYGYDTTMGEFINEQLFVTDLGQRYTITENSSGFQIALIISKRCLAEFEISDKVDDTNFNVKLLSAKESEISFIENKGNYEEENIDTIFGDKPVNLFNLFISGGYINVISQFHFIDKDTPHKINLLYDDAKSDAKNVFLELRHMVDLPESEDVAENNLAQFKISSFRTDVINANTADKFNVTITYKWYDQNSMPVEEVKLQTFKFEIDKANFKKTNLKIR